MSEDPKNSRLEIKRHVVWIRKKGAKPKLVHGFKNAEVNNGIKEQPVFPETFRALEEFFSMGTRDARDSRVAKGLMFHNQGKLFTYREIQYAYDRAFEKAGLCYSATHIMRHGGCRNLYNQVPDTSVAQQLLGNSSLETTLIYAKRSKSALTKVARDQWKKVGGKEY